MFVGSYLLPSFNSSNLGFLSTRCGSSSNIFLLTLSLSREGLQYSSSMLYKVFKNGNSNQGDFGATAAGLFGDDISFSFGANNASVTLIWDALPALTNSSLYSVYVRTGFRGGRSPSFSCGKFG